MSGPGVSVPPTGVDVSVTAVSVPFGVSVAVGITKVGVPGAP